MAARSDALSHEGTCRRVQGEQQLSFKLFAEGRKAEYALRFPFLTEQQISAKLRKVWQAYKKNGTPASSRGRRMAIQRTHALHAAPTVPRHQQARHSFKGDLSMFDLDTDPLFTSLSPSTAARHCSRHTHISSDRQTPRTLSAAADQRPGTSPLVGSFSALSADRDTVCSDNKPPSSYHCCTSDDSTGNKSNRGSELKRETEMIFTSQQTTSPNSLISPRNPLQSLENSTPDLDDQTPTLSLTSHEQHSTSAVCALLQNEAKCFPTNTLPYQSKEAQCGPTLASSNRAKAPLPVMGSEAMGADPKHTPHETGVLELPILSSAGSQPAQNVEETVFLTPPSFCHRTSDGLQSGTTWPSQDSTSSRVPSEFTSLCENALIQSLPSPDTTPPTTASFHGDGARLARQPPARSSDEISGCSVSEAEEMMSTVKSLCSNASNITHAHFSLTYPPDTAPACVPSDPKPASPQCSPSAEVPSVKNWVPYRRLKRYRSKRKNLFSSSHFATAGPLLGKEEESSTVPLLVSQMKGERAEAGLLGECKSNLQETSEVKLLGNKIDEESVNAGASASDSATLDLSVGTLLDCSHPHSEQLVPGTHSPFHGPASPPSQITITSPPRPAKENLMCDMFQQLTPDRPSPGTHSRQHSKLGLSLRLPSKRRVFRSASTEGSSNFYSMFVDESDIFM